MMMLVIAAVLMLAQPAPPPNTVGACAAGRISAADRHEIARALSGDETGGEAAREAATLRLGEHVDACAPGDIEGSNAFVSAMAHVLRDELRMTLGRVGIDSGIVDRWFASQSDAVKLGRPLTDEESERATAAIVAAGLSRQKVDENAELLGRYVSSLIMMERAARDLPIAREE